MNGVPWVFDTASTLSPAAPAPTPGETVEKDRPPTGCRRWAGGVMLPPDIYLSFATRTIVAATAHAVPRLAVVAAGFGPTGTVTIDPADVGRFIRKYGFLRFVGHDVAIDFWVIEQHLRLIGEAEVLAAWWAIAGDSRLHDAMLLDMLVRLARDGCQPVPRSRADLAREYGAGEAAAVAPDRQRDAGVTDRDGTVEQSGLFTELMRDAAATRLSYLGLRTAAATLAGAYDRAGDVLAGARGRFGLLTEAVQVKKAIALAAVTRTGMQVDRDVLSATRADLRSRLGAAVAQVRAVCPELYRTDGQGRVARGATGGPVKRPEVLGAQLAAVVDALRAAGVAVTVPPGPDAQTPSTRTADWAAYRHRHPFVGAWLEVEELTPLLQFVSRLPEGALHPRYEVMVRTGRTACSGPNVQQVPRGGSVRAAFVASPGHLLLAVDYSVAELRALAAHCLHTYGRSNLADVIRAGADPHAHTAALMLGVPVEEFLTWKNDSAGRDGAARRAKYAAARQAAKAINFGVPAGLGGEALRAYARARYGVALTAAEAAARRDLLTRTIYPELCEYLAEDGAAIVGRNLHAVPDAVRAELGDVSPGAIRKVLAGDAVRADGTPYERTFVSRVWAGLTGLNRNPELAERLGRRAPGGALAAAVCDAGVATLTGRVRGRVSYTQARNTPYQGLAADGTALALFGLVRAGFRVVAFVHDEVLVELPDEGGYVSESTVRQVIDIMCRAMERVLGGVPAACEYTLGRSWAASTEPVARAGRVYPTEPAAPGAADPGTEARDGAPRP